MPTEPIISIYGELDPIKASASELRGAAIFNGKAGCAACHPSPYYTDNNMHNLKAERFHKQEISCHGTPLRGVPSHSYGVYPAAAPGLAPPMLPPVWDGPYGDHLG